MTERGGGTGIEPLDNQEIHVLRLLLGVRVARARRQLKLSQRAFAKRMDRSPSWVREIETGEQFAPPYVIAALADALNISVGWFYGEERHEDGPLRAMLDRLRDVAPEGPSSLVALRDAWRDAGFPGLAR